MKHWKAQNSYASKSSLQCLITTNWIELDELYMLVPLLLGSLLLQRINWL